MGRSEEKNEKTAQDPSDTGPDPEATSTQTNPDTYPNLTLRPWDGEGTVGPETAERGGDGTGARQ